MSATVIDASRAGTPSPEVVPQLIDHLFRESAGQVVSTLTRIFGPQYLDLAEDVVQETIIKALRHWTYHGVPDNPSGWIMQVSKNGVLDLLRRERRLRDRQGEIAQFLEERSGYAVSASDVLDHELRDDQLRMIFTCCHPALSREARVALTLKTIGGFSVPEIARAFLVPEATVAQRLVRAKRTVRQAKIPFEVPEAGELPERLDSVLDVLYALFNEGYGAHGGENLVRGELCAEAIRLGSLLVEHPAVDRPRVHALLALMLLQASRLPARTDEGGDLLLLEEQDRSVWDRAMIAAGMHELTCSARGAELSEYHLQAEIAAVHALAPSYEETPWRHILSRYDALLAMHSSPVIALNRTVALAMIDGAEAGLTEIERIRAMPGMETYHLFHATRGDLLRRLGDLEGAANAYRYAATLTANEAEQRFLKRRVQGL